ncbi:hypothetical protein DRN74_07085 [Candidatus Micrarchaeota archaeon]|nr:MAG: hypothetical protein DRN74_07085 [Candidatus Micrarchaeota archaeon]
MNTALGRTDHVYGYLPKDEKRESWVQASDFLKRELQRLDKMQQLGLPGLLHPLARHTRLEHHEGLGYLVRRATEVLTGSRLNGKGENMRFAAVFHGIGHLPVGLDTEAAVAVSLKAYPHLWYSIRQELDKIIERVRAAGGRLGRNSYTNELPWRLYRWFTALKLLRNEDDLPDKMDGAELNVTLRLLLDKEWPLATFLDDLDRFDYVQRDSWHTGLVTVKVNLELLLAKLRYISSRRFAPQDFRMPFLEAIRGTEEVLRRHVYEHQDAVALRAIFQGYLLSAIEAGKLTLEDLLEMRDAELFQRLEGIYDWNSENLVREIREEGARCLCKSRLDVRRLDWPKGVLRIYKSTGLKPRVFQKQLQAQVFPVATVKRRIARFSTVTEQADLECQVWGLRPFSLVPALRAASYLRRQAKDPVLSDGTYLRRIETVDEQVLSCFFSNFAVRYDKYVSIFERSLIRILEIRNIYSLTQKMFEETSRKLETSKSLWLTAIIEFLSSNLKSESEYLTRRLVITFMVSFKEWPKKLRDRIFSNLQAARGVNPGLRKELYIWLQRQTEPPPQLNKVTVISQWTFPEVEFKVGDHESSVDGIAIYLLKGRKPILDLIQCTVNDSPKKRNEDIDRLNQVTRAIRKTEAGRQVRIRQFLNEECVGEQR